MSKVEQPTPERESPASSSEEQSSAVDFSIETLNNFLRQGQEYMSVNMMIQMEYCAGQTLRDFLDNRNRGQGAVVDRAQSFKIFHEIVSGLVEIHNNDVIHRDIKPENIFIDNDTAKIGDFGLARDLDHPASPEKGLMRSNSIYFAGTASPSPSKRSSRGDKEKSYFSSVAGTEAYMAPEIMMHFARGTRPQKYTDIDVNKRQDVFALGLILAELCFKIRTNHQRRQLFSQVRDKRELAENTLLEHQYILDMTEPDPNLRPSSKEILQDLLPKWKADLVQTK